MDKEKIKEMHDSGKSFREIANELGVSCARVQFLYNQHYIHTKENIRSDLYRLYLLPERIDIRTHVSGRTMNVLFGNGIDSIEKLKSIRLCDAIDIPYVGKAILHEIAWFQKKCIEEKAGEHNGNT